VALVALNPHTGQVLALVGGRSYGNSQLNHAVAKRPTGSIFKPFVYAAAFATPPSKAPCCPGRPSSSRRSPCSATSRPPTTRARPEYTPRNFEGEYHGQVTARYALMRR
jgi:penicillin-binding protein 1B